MGSMAPFNHHFSPLPELPLLPPGFIFLYLPAHVQPKKAAEKFFVTKFYEKWYT